MNLLTSLNEEQKKAVLHADGPIMIIAGAGSGKTTVLTRKIAYLLAQKLASPYEILALTFTNKAAKEMKNRIIDLVGTHAQSLWMGTFHSIFSKILRFECDYLGYPNSFTIYDTEDSLSLIKSIIKELNLENKIKPATAAKCISHAKNCLMDAEQFTIKNANLNENSEHIASIYKIYEQRCKLSNAMDFDDLLLNTFKLFDKFPNVLEKYQSKFKYILVDEYQDTNHLQYRITKLLAAEHQNICVVGDDAQSIYAFRGADIQNILNFQKDYPHAKTFKLELNYRSTANIVQAANHVIANNQFQLKKNCYTLNEKGEKIKVIENLNDQEEAQKIANYIREQKVRYAYFNSDFAILYRTNAQSRLLEDALRKVGIPYRIYGGLSFYRRKEVKDALAYLKLAVNPYDEEALLRVINYPPRGIGDTTLEKLITYAHENNLSLWDVIYNIRQLGIQRFTAAVESFAKLIAYNFQASSNLNAYDACQLIIKNSGILAHLKNSNDPQDHTRWENVLELINAAQEFVLRVNENENTLPFFLQEASLFTDLDEEDTDQNTDKVTLMTVHAAKGLEFTSVIIAGLEEGLFPSSMTLLDQRSLEEERRLFYVAITRAKKHLALSYARNRLRFGSLDRMDSSRFIYEIDEQYLEFPNHRLSPLNTNQIKYKNDFTAINLVKFKEITNKNQTIIPPDFIADPIDNIQIGKTVEHFKFGKGKVLHLEGKNDEKKAIVQFEKSGTKTLMLKFAKLKVIE